MSARKNTSGETTIVCSPAEALQQAWYWHRLAKDHPNEMTIRGFCEAVTLISPSQGGARYLRNEARRMQRGIEKQLRQTLEHTMRWRHAPVFILGLEHGATPIVRGYVSRGGTLARCPWCGKAERHEVSTADDEITVSCQTYEAVDYVVRLTRLPILIPAYIPTREPSR
jgi:hypothetical protein